MKKKIAFILSLNFIFMTIAPDISLAKESIKVNKDSYQTETMQNVDHVVLKDFTKRLVEHVNIDGIEYSFTHYENDNKNIIKIDGGDEHTFIAIEKSVDNGVENKNISYANVSGEWTHLPRRDGNIEFPENASKALIAAAIAGFAGGPVGAFAGMASAIYAFITGVRFTCPTYMYSKWRIVGTHVEYYVDITVVVNGKPHNYITTYTR